MSDRLFAVFREVVEECRAISASPDSAPAVQHVLMTTFLDRITTAPLHGYVLANGANPLIRRVFKSINTGGGDDRQRQLENWPTTKMKALVAGIGVAMVFVPSRGEFVELVPDALTPQETREAGRYLIKQGEDSIRRGSLLIDLADARVAANRRGRRRANPGGLPMSSRV